ncbi:MAG: ABC transporter substrate-binding protein [Cellulosilyticaceae bacterium]
MKNTKKLIGLLLSTVILGGCGTSQKIIEVPEQGAVVEAEEGRTLDIWTHYDNFEPVIQLFEERYPDVKVNVTVFPYGEYSEAYIEGLSKGCEADIMLIDSPHFGDFSKLDIFEDLSGAPYNATKYQADYDKEMWEIGKSLDQQKLIGLATASAPIVTYYRKDIMEKYGFPSEPAELAEFMENPDNWIDIGRTLKEDDIYITQWTLDPVTIVGKSMGFFDENLDFQRNNEAFRQGIEIAQKIKRIEMMSYKDIWTPEGEELIRNDQMAMMYLGAWGSGQIQAWAPEQAGKWRVTRLPFNTYGWSNSSLVCIPSQSTEKELAWEFVEEYVFKTSPEVKIGSVSGYLPYREDPEAMAYKNEFLGGQEEQALYEEVLANTNEYMITPLDAEANEIIVNILNLGIASNETIDDMMKAIEEKINKDLSEKKEILLHIAEPEETSEDDKEAPSNP